MSNTIKKHKKHWFFNAGLAVLACVICIWVVKLATIDIDSTKAAVLKQAVKISPNSATAHFLIDLNYADAYECLSNAYLTLDHHEEATEAYKESIRIDLSRRSYPAAFTLIGPRFCFCFPTSRLVDSRRSSLHL